MGEPVPPPPPALSVPGSHDETGGFTCTEASARPVECTWRQVIRLSENAPHQPIGVASCSLPDSFSASQFLGKQALAIHEGLRQDHPQTRCGRWLPQIRL